MGQAVAGDFPAGLHADAGESFMASVPDNPTSNTGHGRIFLRLGLDRQSPHFGYQVVTGYNEQVATSFQDCGDHLNESLYNWWNENTPPRKPTPFHPVFPRDSIPIRPTTDIISPERPLGASPLPSLFSTFDAYS
ncbi:hypothetical protein DSLASN_31020 [Desulfoluna limicola]|uniref:Uncharacterized protein n=1 Tax=Desulfoluna limicola TaxID=2810562 RepID=A0ABN6F6Z8_9BACT|nr:hypothetical protein DSLASN_31020 [Desulfoluna limicola]